MLAQDKCLARRVGSERWRQQQVLAQQGAGYKEQEPGPDGKVVIEATVFICRHELALGLSRGPGHPITAGGGQGAGRKITLVCPLWNPIF